MKKIKKLLLIILVLALSIFVLAGCGDDDDSSSSSSKKKKNNTLDNTMSTSTSTSVTSKESALDNVEKEIVGFTESGDCVIKLKNNNDKNIYIENVTVNFFDNSGTFAEKCNAYNSFFCIPANDEILTYIWGYNKDYSQYPKYEIELSTGDPFCKFHTGLDVSTNNTGSQIAVTVTNTTNADLDSVAVNAVFYKDGKVIGIDTGSTDYGTKIAKNGGKGYINISYPYDKSYNDIKFDDVKVFVISARSDSN